MGHGISFSPLTEELRPRYRAFAAAAFGSDSYQADPAYLDWLYLRAPHTAGLADCRLALKGDEVVGCIHRMRMLWKRGDQVVVVPSVHNTMVRQDCRDGAGGLLIAQSFRGEPFAFVPGTQGAVADMLRRLGFQEQSMTWWMRWVRPVAAAVSLFQSRVFKTEPARLAFNPTTTPSQTEIDELVALANSGWASLPEFRPWWTPHLFAWRLFDPKGPLTCIVTLREGSQLMGYALISFGVRRGLLIARVIDWRVRSRQSVQSLFALVKRESAAKHAHILLAGCGDSMLTDWFKQTGWKQRKDAARAFLYARNQAKFPLKNAFMPSVGDYGLEGFAKPAAA